MRRILQALPVIEEPNELIVGGPDGKPTILSGGAIGDFLAINGDGEIGWQVGGGGGGYTFSDTDSIDFVITGPVVVANAKFGVIAGSVAEGSHGHAQLHDSMVANDTDSIAHVQVGQTFESHAQFGTIAGTVAEGDHLHTGVYSLISHDHNGVYSLLGHNHAGVYQPVGSYQTADAQLSAIAALTPTGDSFIYWTDATTAVLQTITSFGRDLLDDLSVAAQRTTLGLSAMATMNPASVAITGGTIAGITDLAIADGGTGASNAATARDNLGLEIGVDIPSISHTHPLSQASKISVVEEFDVGVATALKINNGSGPSSGMAASGLAGDLPGVWTLSTNSTNNNFRMAHYGWQDTGLGQGSLRLMQAWEFEFVGLASSVTCEYFIGLTNKTDATSVETLVTSSAFAMGLVAYNGGATYGANTTTWKFAQANTPAATIYTETGVDIDQDIIYMKMVHDGAGNVTRYLENALGATYSDTTTTPSNAGTNQRCTIIAGIQTRTAAAKLMHLDYIKFDGLVTRGGII